MKASVINLPGPSFRNVMLVALWFGLLAGLLEGIAKWAFPVLGWAGQRRFCLGDLKGLWAPVVADVALFLCLGLLLWPILNLVRRWPWLLVASTFFTTLTAYGVVAAPGRLRERGAVMLALGMGVVAGRWLRRRPQQGLPLLQRTLTVLLALVVAACLLPWPAVALQERLARVGAPAPPTGAPSVLLIVLDTVRADRLGAYGYDRPTTPFLDAYAKRSVLFEQATANASWSLPSHLALLTGRLPDAHGGQHVAQSFDGRFPSLAQILSAHGYATAAFAANSGYASCSRGLGYGFQRYEDCPKPTHQLLHASNLVSKLHRNFFAPWLRIEGLREWHDARQINQRFLQWLGARNDRPFFAFLNYMEAHYPYNAPQPQAAQFAADPRPIPSTVWYPMRFGERPLDPQIVRHGSDLYDASLAYLDQQIAALFEQLRRRNLDRNLLVVITSDHGEAFAEHGLLEHQASLYRVQIQVPLILRLPGQTSAGTGIAAPVGLNQVPATVASLVGAKDHPFPGIPLSQLWGASPPEDPAVISELAGGPWPGVPKFWPTYQGSIRSVLTSRWHLLVPENAPVELYDLAADPGEAHNLAADPAMAEIVADLRRRLPN